MKHARSDDDDISDDDVSFDTVKKAPRLTCHDSWITKYAPKTTKDLCLNPRKLVDLRNAVRLLLDQGPRLLVVTGPSGSGKSTAVKLVAEELVAGPEPWVEYLDLNVGQRSSQFGEFLHDCRYRTGPNLSVVVVEELPNVFHGNTLQAFRSAVREWVFLDATVPPLVICITELEMEHDREYYSIDNSLSAETLLGRDLLLARQVVRIKFNPVARTYIQKTISHIIAREPTLRHLPQRTKEMVLQLAESGDIRSVIENLEVWARLRADGMFLRESHILLFHAVGKVIFSSSKFADDDDADFKSVEDVLANYGNTGLLHLALLENYTAYNGLEYTVDVAANIADYLSVADTLSDAKDVALRGCRSQLRTLPKTKQHPLKFPRHFKMLKQQRRVHEDVAAYGRWLEPGVRFDDLNQIDGCLVPQIYNLFKYKQRHGQKRAYGRLGGRFVGIFADDVPPTMEAEVEQQRDQFYYDIASAKEGNGISDDELSESIEDSATDEDDDFNDSLDGDTINRLFRPTFDDTFSDDPELDLLVSQGRI